MFFDAPKRHADPEAVATKLALYARDEFATERGWVTDLQERRSTLVPLPDPAGGGLAARVLFVLEAPGPMTNGGNARPGSGFISVDNDDQTAKNMWLAMREAGLSQTECLHWNIVPWYLGAASRKPSAAERAEGAIELRRLIAAMPNLREIVLAGQHAQDGWRRNLGDLEASFVVTAAWHTAAQSFSQPGKRDDFVASLRTIVGRLDLEPKDGDA